MQAIERTNQESRICYILKAFAILSVIAAHVTKINITDEGITYIIAFFWKQYGQVGVVAFFIMSGFFYERQEGDIKRFWRKKFRTLIVPWIICSSITYGLSMILSEKGSIAGYVKWIFGFYTWYYFIVMLLFLFVIYKFIGTNTLLITTCIMVSLFMYIFVTVGGRGNSFWNTISECIILDWLFWNWSLGSKKGDFSESFT